MRRFTSIAVLLFAVCLAALPLWGQTGMTTGGSSNRPIFVRGTVALASGGPLPQKAKIELVCQANVQSEGQTDAKGGFSVQLGMNRFEGNSDASATSQSMSGRMGGALESTGAPAGSGAARQVDGASIQSLMGCFIRASLTGYRSDAYSLDHVTVGDVTTDAGTLLLHDLSKTADAVVSSTSLAAPKDAKKSLDKALEEISKRDFTDAEADLKKAVQSYPKYAEAWQEMGEAPGRPEPRRRGEIGVSTSHLVGREVPQAVPEPRAYRAGRKGLEDRRGQFRSRAQNGRKRVSAGILLRRRSLLQFGR